MYKLVKCGSKTALNVFKSKPGKLIKSVNLKLYKNLYSKCKNI